MDLHFLRKDGQPLYSTSQQRTPTAIISVDLSLFLRTSPERVMWKPAQSVCGSVKVFSISPITINTTRWILKKQHLRKHSTSTSENTLLTRYFNRCNPN